MKGLNPVYKLFKCIGTDFHNPLPCLIVLMF
jgi:hypothetical protein